MKRLIAVLILGLENWPVDCRRCRDLYGSRYSGGRTVLGTAQK